MKIDVSNRNLARQRVISSPALSAERHTRVISAFVSIWNVDTRGRSSQTPAATGCESRDSPRQGGEVKNRAADLSICAPCWCPSCNWTHLVSLQAGQCTWESLVFIRQPPTCIWCSLNVLKKLCSFTLLHIASMVLLSNAEMRFSGSVPPDAVSRWCDIGICCQWLRCLPEYRRTLAPRRTSLAGLPRLRCCEIPTSCGCQLDLSR